MFWLSNPKIWVISDTHFYHRTILEKEPIRRRLGATVEDMNWAIADIWNSVVSPRDVVVHLGDVSFKTNTEAKELVSGLAGYKVLIKGNHDRSIRNSVFESMGFGEIYEDPLELIDPYGERFVMSHEPVLDTDVLNIHGHIHSSGGHRPSEVGSDPDLFVNVSIENLKGFKPVLLSRVLEEWGDE